MASVYPGMKPMLEFVGVPEQVKGRPRRRRCAVKTPKNPRVKSVPLEGNQQPDIKWVSPQFNIEVGVGRAHRPRARRGVLEIKTSKRAVQSLQFDDEDSPHISIYPSLAPHLMNKPETNQTLSTQEADDKTVHQKTCQSFNMDNFSTDQTVPDLTDSCSQQSMEDSDETTEEIAELSDLVGSMSLENATKSIHTTLPHVDITNPGNETDLSVPGHEDVYSHINPDRGKVVEDKNLMEHCHTQVTKTVNQTFVPNSSQMVHSSQSLNMLKRTRTFQPPSTSTPNRHGDTSLPHQTTPYIDHSTKRYDSTTQLSSPSLSSDFMLQLTATTNSHYDEQLDSYDTNGEESDGDDDSGFILATETPQHLWRSPQVKVIDSTFS